MKGILPLACWSPCCQLTAALVTKSMGTLQASTSDALLTPGQQRFHKMTPWHHDIPLIGFWGRKTVVGGWWHVFFHGMTHIIHDLPGFFPRPHVWNAVIDWSGQSSRKKRFSVHLHSQMSCCHCLGETPYVFFWAGPQSQWSMQNRLFGCEHSNWPRCKSLGFPKTAFFTQFSVRLLTTQSVSKFSCQVLIQNKLYIAMYIHTWLYIYIYFIIHILYYIHIKPAMFHPKWQKIPRHGGSFAAFFKPRMQCSRQKIQELRQMLQHELVQSPVGEIFLPEVWMSPLNLLGWA